MYGRWHGVGTKLLFAVGAPVGGLVIVVASITLTAFGPEMLAGNWVGRAMLSVLGFAGSCLVVFTQLRYENCLVFFGAGFALIIGMTSIRESVEEQAFHLRGEITMCTVRDVDERDESSWDSEGGTTSRVYYDYRLACADPQVREITTASRVAEQGGRIKAFHDPAGRLEPRLAASVGDPRSSLELGTALFGIGTTLRLLYELGVPPFRMEWIGVPWRTHMRRRRFRRRRGEPAH